MARYGVVDDYMTHSLHTGYPIINDPMYNHSAWGINKGKGGVDCSNMDKVRI